MFTGGGNEVGSGETNISVALGNIVGDIYGGSNKSGDVLKSNININGGDLNNIYRR